MTRSAVLLAGGRSRRLGMDKPLVEVGGRSVLARVLDATAAIDDVVISVRDPAPLAAALRAMGWREGRDGDGGVRFDRGVREARLVADRRPGRGPVAGLAAGLAAARGDSAIVLAADLPFVTPALVDALLTALEGAADADVCAPVIDGRPQWLCAAYRKRVAPRAAAWLDEPSGDGSVHGLADRLSVLRVGQAVLARLGDPVALTRGIDTPEDLKWASDRAGMGEDG